jgi:hypothetical protein
MEEQRYTSWEDLLEEDTPLGQESQKTTTAAENTTTAGPIDVPLPDAYAELLAEKKRLEDQLKKLTGQAEPDAEEKRQQLMYPVKVHTKESRLAERQKRRREARAALLKQRSLEKNLSARKLEIRAFEQKEEWLEQQKKQQLIEENLQQQRQKATQAVQQKQRKQDRLQQLLDERIQQAVEQKKMQQEALQQNIRMAEARREQLKAQRLAAIKEERDQLFLRLSKQTNTVAKQSLSVDLSSKTSNKENFLIKKPTTEREDSEKLLDVPFEQKHDRSSVIDFLETERQRRLEQRLVSHKKSAAAEIQRQQFLQDRLNASKSAKEAEAQKNNLRQASLARKKAERQEEARQEALRQIALERRLQTKKQQ